MKALTDQDPMPFGDYKGEKLEHVPAKRLLWYWEDFLWREKNYYPELREYIIENFGGLQMEAPDLIIMHDPRRK